MIRWLLRSRVVRLMCVVLFSIVLLAGAFWWRLGTGPIALHFLDAQIAAAVSALAPDVTATVERTELARAGRGLALRVTGLTLRRPDGTALMSLPALSVRPSLSALLHGRVVITRVGVDDADLALTRTPEGEWRLGNGEGGAGVAVLELLGASTGTPPTDSAATVALPRIELTRTQVTIDDQRAGGSLVLTNGDLLIRPRAGGIDVTVSAALSLESGVPPVRGTLRLPVQATAAIARGADGTLGQIDFTLAGDKGELAPAGDSGAPFALAELDAKGVYLPAVETLRFARVTAAVGSSRLDAKASVIFGNARPAALGAAPMLALDGTVDALTMTALTRLWPADLGTTVRTWLMEHTREGTLRKCRVQLGLHAAPADGAAATPAVAAEDPAAANGGGPTAAKPDAYDIACDFDGVTAHYLPPMAPIRAASGAARLTAERLEVNVRRGEIGACTVERGTLAMNLTVDPARAEIAADLNGAAADVLALIDAPPLQLVTPLGITPKDLGGTSRVHAELTLPIKHDVTGREVGVQANATLTGASLPPLVAGIGLSDGTLEVKTDGRGIAVTGTTSVTGLPEIKGPVTVAVTVAPEAKTDSGRDGSSKDGANARQITLEVDGDGVTARGTAALTGSAVTALTVERLRLAGHDLAGTFRRSAAGDYTATLSGDRLDLAALIADPRLTAADGAALGASYDVALELGRVQATPDTELRNVRGSLQGNGGSVTALSLTGTLPGNGAVQATIDGPSEARRFRVTSDQAGPLLTALGIPTKIEGGSLALDATTDARGPKAFLTGELALHDFRVVEAPVLAKVLSLGSLTSVAALINRKSGLAFSEGKVPFRWTEPRLEVMGFRAVGGIGLTGDGVIDRRADTCDLRGTIVPIYVLNTALGKLPLLNRVPILGALVGGNGKGIFGLNYRVNGTLPDPPVNVNPLTTIAPGVLRSWFVDPFTRPAR
ncbi:MAG: AsmA-like C-terminal region-containing protein [Candidatus Binatia bacterium]